MLRLLPLACLLASTMSFAEEQAPRSYLNLDRFSLKVMHMTGNRDPMIPEIPVDKWMGRVAAEFDLSLIDDVLFWRNDVHGEAALGKFMTLGWRYELGLYLGPHVEAFWEHHSRHTLDVEPGIYYDRLRNEVLQSRFPVEDSFGLRITFYKRK